MAKGGKAEGNNVWSLRGAGDVDGLTAILSDDGSSSGDRFLAAKFLGDLGAQKAEHQLLAALSDADDDVRIAAIVSLGSLRSDLAANRLHEISMASDESKPVAEWALHALVDLGDARAVRALEQILENPDKHRRRWAARELGRLGENRSVAPLRAAQARDGLLFRHVYRRAIDSCQHDCR